MGRILIKPLSNDEDFYVVWTTVADGPIKLGTKAELQEKPTLKDAFSNIIGLLNDKPYSASKVFIEINDAAFDVADETGSAYLDGSEGWYPWDEEEPLMFAAEDASYNVYRKDFDVFIHAYATYADTTGEGDSHPAIVGHLEIIE